MFVDGKNYISFEVLPYLYDGVDTYSLEREFKRFGWAKKYAGKLLFEYGIYCEIVGVRFDNDYNLIRDVLLSS